MSKRKMHITFNINCNHANEKTTTKVKDETVENRIKYLYVDGWTQSILQILMSNSSKRKIAVELFKILDKNYSERIDLMELIKFVKVRITNLLSKKINFFCFMRYFEIWCNIDDYEAYEKAVDYMKKHDVELNGTLNWLIT